MYTRAVMQFALYESLVEFAFFVTMSTGEGAIGPTQHHSFPHYVMVALNNLMLVYSRVF